MTKHRGFSIYLSDFNKYVVVNKLGEILAICPTQADAVLFIEQQ